MKGRAYTTLTDNKTFIFTAACFADNQMTWNLFATKKQLDYSTKREIFAHAESLGYKREYFTEIRYDSCGSRSHGKKVNQVTSSHMSSAGRSHLCKMCQQVCPSMNFQFPFGTKYLKQNLEKYYKK